MRLASKFYSAVAHRVLDEEIDRHMKEFSQPFCLRLADRASAAQHFSGGTLFAKNRPNILVFQSTFFHQCVQRLVGRHAGQRIILLFVIFDVETTFLFPWAVLFSTRQAGFRLPEIYALASMFVFLGILIIGYVWLYRKGALEWV